MTKIYVQKKERTVKNTFDLFHRLIFRNKRNRMTEIILLFIILILPILTILGILWLCLC